MGEKRAEAREKIEEKKTTRMFWQVVLHINIFFFFSSLNALRN